MSDLVNSVPCKWARRLLADMKCCGVSCVKIDDYWVASMADLRRVAAMARVDHPCVLVDSSCWPVFIQVHDGALWLLEAPHMFAATRFACEVTGDDGHAAKWLAEHGPLRVLHATGDGDD